MTKHTFGFSIFVNLAALSVALLFGADFVVAAGIGIGAQIILT